MDQVLSAARALVARWKETTAVHAEMEVLEQALEQGAATPANDASGANQ